MFALQIFKLYNLGKKVIKIDFWNPDPALHSYVDPDPNSQSHTNPFGCGSATLLKVEVSVLSSAYIEKLSLAALRLQNFENTLFLRPVPEQVESRSGSGFGNHSISGNPSESGNHSVS